MYIKRDITHLLQTSPALIQVLLGPRQCGKSTLFAALYPMSEHTPKVYNEVTFDDLQMRQLANRIRHYFCSSLSRHYYSMR